MEMEGGPSKLRPALCAFVSSCFFSSVIVILTLTHIHSSLHLEIDWQKMLGQELS